MIIRTVDPTEPAAIYLHDMLQSEYTGLYGFPDPNPDGGIEGCFAHYGRTYVGYDPATHRPIALAAWGVLSPEDTAHTGIVTDSFVATLKRVYTHFGHRGMGLASSMIAHCEAGAKELGMSHLVLETGTAQTSAISLYRARGYDEVGGYGYYRGEDTSIFMGKAL